MPLICGILLAAGRASRFGSHKLLCPLPDGTPMAAACARNLLPGVDRAIAVVRPEDEPLARLLRAEGMEVAPCATAAEGMGASLAWGVGAAPQADGWLIVLADMPAIRPATMQGIARLLRQGVWAAAPAYRGRRGHPVGFGQPFREELLRLKGDIGARPLLARYSHRLRILDSDDPGILTDIDTPRDLHALGHAISAATAGHKP